MEGKPGRSPFIDSVRGAIRVKHYSYRTEQTYVQWAKWFILYNGKPHPSEMGEAEVAAFLTDLAVVGRVSPGTQNQALNALVFLYRYVLRRPLGDIVGAVRAKRRQRLPVVLTLSEVGALLDQLEGVYWLIGCVLYGSGLRLRETVGLRVKDLDFDHRALLVRDGKGGRARCAKSAWCCLGRVAGSTRGARCAGACRESRRQAALTAGAAPPGCRWTTAPRFDETLSVRLGLRYPT